LSLAVLTYNLSVLFARHLGWLDKVTIGTLRYRLFATAGILSHGRAIRPSSSVCRWKIDLGGERFGRSSSPISQLQCSCPMPLKT